MANTLAVGFGVVVLALVLVAVLGAVERRGKFAFVAGVILVALAPVLVDGGSGPATIGGIVGVVGFLAVVASTVPLLRQSATTA